MTWRIVHGECSAAMAAMPAASVDAVVCDPPYGIGFMGKTWDGAAIAEAAQRDRDTRKSLGPESASRPGRAQPRSSSAFGNEAIIAGPVRGGRDFQEWCESWAREALRVLKPGGHLLAFGGTRTAHRLVCAIEDAGFEVRDTIAWMYGSGFPKSLNVSAAIDKSLGAVPIVTGPHPTNACPGGVWCECETDGRAFSATKHAPATAPATAWSGWGTALKPAHEPIVVARKPLTGTVAANVLQHGTGALNVDGCRVDVSPSDRETWSRAGGWMNAGYVGEPSTSLTGGVDGTLNRADTNRNDDARGRWPANVVLSHSPECREVGTRKVRGDNRTTGNGTRPSGFANIGAAAGDGEPNAAVYGDSEVPAWDCVPDCAVRLLDEQTGTLTSNSSTPFIRNGDTDSRASYGTFDGNDAPGFYGDTGGASRFFYCPKADGTERHAGLSGEPSLFSTGDEPERNDHPTVKPLDLMRWLVRLVTPPGGTVLDPFAGSGTTGCAAVLEGFDFIGIEREAEYVAICNARLTYWSTGQAAADLAGTG